MSEAARFAALLGAAFQRSAALFALLDPDALLARPFLRPVYDDPAFVVRNVWRRYGGWWDGNPARLLGWVCACGARLASPAGETITSTRA